MKLEEISPGAQIVGIDTAGPVVLIAVDVLGDDAVSVVYRGASGVPADHGG